MPTITPAWPENEGPKIEEKVELRVPGVPIPVIGYIADMQHKKDLPYVSENPRSPVRPYL